MATIQSVVFIQKVTAANMLELEMRAAVYLPAMKRESEINALLNLCHV